MAVDVNAMHCSCRNGDWIKLISSRICRVDRVTYTVPSVATPTPRIGFGIDSCTMIGTASKPPRPRSVPGIVVWARSVTVTIHSESRKRM